jgi:hypothetical protein
LHNPVEQVFVTCALPSPDANLEPGVRISIQMDLASFESEVDIAMFMRMQHSAIKFEVVDYEWVGLDELSVISSRDVTELVNMIAAGNSLDAQLEAIRRITKQRREDVRQTRRVRAPGRGRGVGGGRGGRALGRGGHEAVDAPDELAEGEPESDDDPHDDHEDIGAGEVDAYWEVRMEEAAAAVDPPPPPAVDGLPIAEFHAANVVLYLDPVTRRRMGRQSLIRPGQHSESASIYCNLHGCSICIATHRCPSVDALKQWFKDGHSIPRGAPGKALHKRDFPRV